MKELFTIAKDAEIPDIILESGNISVPAKDKLFIYIFNLRILNFFVFFVFSLIIGGDAGNGFVKDGHYFVTNHGKHTEVSELIWKINKFQADSLFITHPMAIIAAIIANLKNRNK